MKFWLISLLFLTAFAYGHGGESVNFGGDEAKLVAFELPVEIGLDGNISLHSPFGSEEHEHEHEHADGDIDADMDHHEHEHKTIEVAFSPLLGVGLNLKNRMISLEESRSLDASALELASDSSEFDNVRIRQFQLGLGAEATIGNHDSNALMIGILPYKGTSVIAKNRFSPKKALPALKVPNDQIDFLTWMDGDSLEYQTEGGIMFSAAFGTHLIGSLGGNLMLSGTWDVKIVKLNQDLIQVGISHVKMKKAGVEVGNLFTSLGTSWMNNFSQSFSYVFDLSRSSGITAYQEFLRGKLDSALALSQNYDGAVKESSSDKTSVGKIKFFTLGTPLLAGFQKGQGLMYEVSNVEHFDHAHKEKLFSHIFAKSTEINGPLIKDSKNHSFIISTVHTHPGENESKKMLTFKWLYEKENQSLNRLNNFLEKSLAQFNIIGSELRFNFNKMSYVRAETDLTLKNEQFVKLENISNDSFWSNWENQRLAEVAQICNRKLHCVKTNSLIVKDNLKDLRDSFTEMLKAQKEGDFKNLSKELNLFGQALLSSPLNLKILGDVIKDLKIVVTLQGESFKKYYRVYKFN